MSQIFEALRRAAVLEAARKQSDEHAERASAERRRSDRRPLTAQIRVYGHGARLAPFFEENSVLNASETGALLVMKIPVVAGQKLLLINETAEQVQECRVVRTSCRDPKELEVGVEFPIPQPQFWKGLENAGVKVEKRSFPRVTLPRGMSITWKGSGDPMVSRVETISSGGLSIAALEVPPVGELIEVRFEVPNGEVGARAIVRHSQPGQRMGIQFLHLAPDSRGRLNYLMQKLLR